MLLKVNMTTNLIENYSVYQEAKQAYLGYGLVSGLNCFHVMAELPQKLLLTLNMVKSGTIIVISLLLPR